jgi:hypothetical protein
VVDPNYEVDENGKLTFRKGGIKRLRTSNGKAESSPRAVQTAIQPTINDQARRRSRERPSSSGRRRRRNHSDSEHSEDEVDDYLVVDESQLEGKDFLLGDFKDAMTLKPMLQPAISPYGHVLDYLTWLRILRQNPVNTCPFTKQRVTRRALVKLTKENLEAYRDKIVEVSFNAAAMSLAYASSPLEEEEEVPSVSEEEQQEAIAAI